MRNVLIAFFRFVGWVVGALPRAILAIVGMSMMGIGVAIKYGDTVAGNEGRPTFFLRLAEVTQSIGLGPWHAVFMYYSPMIIGMLFVAIAVLSNNRPRITRR